MAHWDIETDLVGGGGAGLTAASTAAILAPHLDVVVLEKDAAEPCSSEIASNFIPAAGTRFQRAAGVEDSPEIFAEDVLRKNGGRSDPALTLEFYRRSAERARGSPADSGTAHS